MSKEPCWDGNGRGGVRACESLCSEDSATVYSLWSQGRASLAGGAAQVHERLIGASALPGSTSSKRYNFSQLNVCKQVIIDWNSNISL